MDGPQDAPDVEQTRPDAAIRDHLANERTLLAWQRTALALIGLGFVVDRFALDGPEGGPIGAVVGLGMIAVGAMAAGLGVRRFILVEHQIDTETYRPALLAHLLLAAAILVCAAGLALYIVVR